MTRLSDALTAARVRLKEAGIVQPGLDARLLMEAASGLDGAAQISKNHTHLNAKTIELFQAMVARRVEREPVARILGNKDFWGLTFSLSDATLVPRPDTETLVEAVLKAIKSAGLSHSSDQPISFCDLGTGCGAILIALLSELPSAKGIGLDISEEAIVTARENAKAHNVLDRVRFLVNDYRSATIEPVSILVSNPPYIPSADIKTLDRDVACFDPSLALDGGSDGLDAYRIITARLASFVRRNGLVALEVGLGQAETVRALLAKAGWPVSTIHKDLAGHDRVVLAMA